MSLVRICTLVGVGCARAVEQLTQDGEALVDHLCLAVAWPLVQVFAALWAETSAVLAAERAHRQRQHQILANRLAGVYFMVAVDREGQFGSSGAGTGVPVMTSMVG